MKTQSAAIKVCCFIAVFLFALTGVVQAQFTYTNNSGTLTITGYTDTNAAATIPSTIDGYPVTSIGDGAFSFNYILTSMTISTGVTNIGNGAFFNCSYLTSVAIPASVVSIGSAAFDSTLLTNVIIPDGVTTISDFTFSACNYLMGVTIPGSVTNIGEYAFTSCWGLTNLTLPNSLRSIGFRAFEECVGLTNVSIPASVTSFDNTAFQSCTRLAAITVDPMNPVYSSKDGVVFNKSQTTLLLCPNGKTGDYTIPDGVNEIADSAFDCSSETDFTSLTSVTVPGSVASIGNGAFVRCVNLKGIYFMGNAPANLGADVFYHDFDAIAYYLPGTTGWSSMFGDLPTALWFLPQPLILTSGSGFGIQTNGFCFTISWATNSPVAVEACTDLSSPDWQPLQTNTLVDGTSYFSDSQRTNYPGRFYRLRSP